MLKQRIITAAILLLVLLVSAVWLPSVCFRILVAAGGALMLWEWLRLTLPRANWAAGIALLFFLVFSAVGVAAFPEAPAQGGRGDISLTGFTTWAAGLSVLFWTFFAPAVFYRADTNRTPVSVVDSIAAILIIGTTVYGLGALHYAHGAWFLVSFLAIIWSADTFAYFGGKHFGGAKLAPAISPGKTRSGAVCGLLAALVWMGATLFMDGSFAHYLAQYFPPVSVILFGGLLAVYSVIGDLFESLTKRRAGIKDSSRLLPGHGGVWDRMDSVVAVTPVVILLWLLVRHFS